jgi:hypothetical protein
MHWRGADFRNGFSRRLSEAGGPAYSPPMTPPARYHPALAVLHILAAFDHQLARGDLLSRMRFGRRHRALP